MENKNKIVTNVSNTFNKVAFKIKKNSPEILIVVGIVGTVVSTVMACKATTKVSKILDDTKKDVDIIHDTLEKEESIDRAEGEEPKYTLEDSKKDLTITYVNAGRDIFKLYAPSLIIGTLSITSILTSHNILRQRNMALATAYATINKSFKIYRENVVERYGEEIDNELRYNIKAKTIEETVVDEKTGKEKNVKKTVKVTDPNLTSDYACYFDSSCTAYDTSNDYNLTILRAQERYANDMLIAHGHLFLNEVYDMLGKEHTRMGQVTGWIYDPEGNHDGDNHVNFHILETFRETADGDIEPAILLDFNVDGPILNYLN